ncbi:MAG: hypothetical protein IH991_04865 [Planctomycetes bacterium]|nr:hypothetical protein [Planctomycetota bacterium]
MKPVLQALLLADRVYRDTTGKHIIAGTFNKLMFKPHGAEPKPIVKDGEERHVISGGMQAGSPTAYISLTEIRGTTKFELRYVNLERDQAIFRCEFTIKCDNPLETVEVIIPLLSLPPIAGTHALELLSNNELLGSHRVLVEEIEGDHNGDDDDSQN